MKLKTNPAESSKPRKEEPSTPSASSTAFLNKTQSQVKTNTAEQRELAAFPATQSKPSSRPVSPFPGVFVPQPRSTSPPRDLRKLIHPQSLRPPVSKRTDNPGKEKENPGNDAEMSNLDSKNISNLGSINGNPVQKSFDLSADFVPKEGSTIEKENGAGMVPPGNPSTSSQNPGPEPAVPENLGLIIENSMKTRQSANPGNAPREEEPDRDPKLQKPNSSDAKPDSMPENVAISHGNPGSEDESGSGNPETGKDQEPKPVLLSADDKILEYQKNNSPNEKGIAESKATDVSSVNEPKSEEPISRDNTLESTETPLASKKSAGEMQEQQFVPSEDVAVTPDQKKEEQVAIIEQKALENKNLIKVEPENADENETKENKSESSESKTVAGKDDQGIVSIESAENLGIIEEKDIQNIDKEIQNIASQLEIAEIEPNADDILESIIAEDISQNSSAKEELPEIAIKEIINEELTETKRLSEVLQEKEAEEHEQELTHLEEERVRKEQEKRKLEQEEIRKREEYQKMLLQQEQLKLTPYQIQAREEKNKLRLRHLEEGRSLTNLHVEEMNKLKAEQEETVKALKIKQEYQKQFLSPNQMKHQLEELKYLHQLQKQKLAQEHFIQQQRLKQRQQEEVSELQKQLDELDRIIQEEFFKQQEEERKALEQLKYEEEMRKLKDEQEKLLKLEREREEELRKEKELFLQQIYREQCLKMFKETGVKLSSQEMLEFMVGLGIEITIDQIKKFSDALDAEQKVAKQREEAILREQKTAQQKQELLRKEQAQPTPPERKISKQENRPEFETLKAEIEVGKFKDEAEAEEYVNQQKLRHKMQLEQKSLEAKKQKTSEDKKEGNVEKAVERKISGKGGKPASSVAGAIPIFGGDANALSTDSKTNNMLHEELQKRMPTKKGESESRTDRKEKPAETESGVVYESKPFKDLIETFEENTRPAMKVKQMIENTQLLRSISGVDINETVQEIVSKPKEPIHQQPKQQTQNTHSNKVQIVEKPQKTETEPAKTESRSQNVSRSQSTTKQLEMMTSQLTNLLKQSELSLTQQLSADSFQRLLNTGKSFPDPLV